MKLSNAPYPPDASGPQASTRSDASAAVPPLSTIAPSTGVAPNGTLTLAGEDTAGPLVTVGQATAVIGLGWALACIILSQGSAATLSTVCGDTWFLFFAAWLVLISVGRARFSVGGGDNYNNNYNNNYNYNYDNDDWQFPEDHGPSVNIDGTPMCGYVDANGNPYGVTRSSID